MSTTPSEESLLRPAKLCPGGNPGSQSPHGAASGEALPGCGLPPAIGEGGGGTLPRAPRDAIEREAITSHGPGCNAMGPRRLLCTRRPHAAGDHVAAGPTQILDRWSGRENP
jgi:hypothetical protein